MKNNQYDTLATAINQLQKRGFTHNFRINENGQMEEQKGKFYSPNEVGLVSFIVSMV